jgi:hypothetical protein
MSKEIWQSYDGTTALYAFVHQPSNGYIWDPSIGTPAFVVWNAANIANYDIPLVASGRMYYADFPVLITTAGVYQVFICARAGLTPAITDIIISQGFMEWDGAAEITLSMIDTNVDSLITARGIINNVSVQEETNIELTKARIYI